MLMRFVGDVAYTQHKSRGWISQGIVSYGRGHGTRETCVLHTARLPCGTKSTESDAHRTLLHQLVLYKVSVDSVQDDWRQKFADVSVAYHYFEWAMGMSEGKCDILDMENVGANGLDLAEFSFLIPYTPFATSVLSHASHPSCKPFKFPLSQAILTLMQAHADQRACFNFKMDPNNPQKGVGLVAGALSLKS
ncbi:hypothetical protein VNO77_04368 [Canavalia gladiata]|uniref:Uncharacterized protein n=1 Tax=Canavalia gladiata TaxID=3824 RepID=A0AAN9N2W8_CANGL